MSPNKFPKVYILLEPFNDYTGMGVTMTNLFKDWPQDRIAIAANQLDVELCERIRPCHSYLALSTPSSGKETSVVSKQSKFQAIKVRIRRSLKNVYLKAGGSDLKRLPVDVKLLRAIDDFHPDIIFTALGSLDRIRFVEKIMDKTPYAKLAVYIVDDWPNTKQNGRWFPAFWRKKYDNALRKLLSRSTYRLSICQAMSDSYLKQYGLTFVPFHNPVDVRNWQSVKSLRRYDRDTFSIVYVGKINRDTKTTICNLASVVTDMNSVGGKVHFDVYSPNASDIDTSKYIGFTIRTSVPNSTIPALLKSYDCLFLTLGFSKISRAYTRLSMPTKLTEYLGSDVPILLNAPTEIAVTKYARENDVALICDSENKEELENKMKTLIEDSALRERIAANALGLAEQHDVNIVREQFRKALI